MLAMWAEKCNKMVKDTVSPRTGHEGPQEGVIFSSTLSLSSAPDAVGGQRHPHPLYPRIRSDTHCIECWVGSRAGLDGCGKSPPLPGKDPWTV